MTELRGVSVVVVVFIMVCGLLGCGLVCMVQGYVWFGVVFVDVIVVVGFAIIIVRVFDFDGEVSVTYFVCAIHEFEVFDLTGDNGVDHLEQGGD